MKIGKIAISNKLIEERISIRPLFQKFLPVYIERKPYEPFWIYSGICDDFEDLTEECVDIPFYDVTISDGECKFNKL